MVCTSACVHVCLHVQNNSHIYTCMYTHTSHTHTCSMHISSSIMYSTLCSRYTFSQVTAVHTLSSRLSIIEQQANLWEFIRVCPCAWARKDLRNFLLHIPTSQCVPPTHSHKLIERKPTPRGGFLFAMFPHQEPWVDPPRRICTRCFEGGPLTHGSWWGNIVNRKPPRGVGFLSIKVLHIQRVPPTHSRKSMCPSQCVPPTYSMCPSYTFSQVNVSFQRIQCAPPRHLHKS